MIWATDGSSFSLKLEGEFYYERVWDSSFSNKSASNPTSAMNFEGASFNVSNRLLTNIPNPMQKTELGKISVLRYYLRNWSDGWEVKELLGGTKVAFYSRSYFFNSETGDCQWKPPRFLNRPSLVSAAMNGAMGHYDNVVVPLTDVPTHEDDSVASCSAPVSPLTAVGLICIRYSAFI